MTRSAGVVLAGFAAYLLLGLGGAEPSGSQWTGRWTLWFTGFGARHLGEPWGQRGAFESERDCESHRPGDMWWWPGEGARALVEYHCLPDNVDLWGV